MGAPRPELAPVAVGHLTITTINCSRSIRRQWGHDFGHRASDVHRPRRDHHLLDQCWQRSDHEARQVGAPVELVVRCCGPCVISQLRGSASDARNRPELWQSRCAHASLPGPETERDTEAARRTVRAKRSRLMAVSGDGRIQQVTSQTWRSLPARTLLGPRGRPRFRAQRYVRANAAWLRVGSRVLRRDTLAPTARARILR